MNIKRNFKSYIGLLIIFTSLFLVGCGSNDTEPEAQVEVEAQVIEEIKSEETEETDSEHESEVEEANFEEGLEVIDGSPIGDYKASGVTHYMIIKIDPLTQNNRPGGFLEGDHPYIKEIDSKLEDLFMVLYEIDYKTLTDDRYADILKGELDEDNEYRNITGAISNEVITEVIDINTRTIDFQVGMEQARVSSEVIYHVLQSQEQESVWNTYLEGRNFVASVISEVERIDDQWEVVHVFELTVKELDEEN